MSDALNITNLSKNYSQLKALDKVTINIPQNVIAGIVGPNGAGKTTLFSLIAKFIQPSEGEIKIFEQSVKQLQCLSGLLAMLPQDAGFPARISFRKLFNWYARLAGLTAKQAKLETERVADSVALKDALDSKSSQLSHGMNKRMAIAQALIGKPKLIILDEPTAGLDPAVAYQIRELIRSLKEKHTVIVSSHNLNEIADVCEHITILKNGRVIESGEFHSQTLQASLTSLTFKFKTLPDETLVSQLKALASIHSIEFIAQDKKVRCVVDQQANHQLAALREILLLLEERQVQINHIQFGETLEERFLQMTQ